MAFATEFIVERYASGRWTIVPTARCTQIVHNTGSRPSTAEIEITDSLWDQKGGWDYTDRVRVTTTETDIAARTLLFDGVLTTYRPVFSGGSSKSKPIEQAKWMAKDLRYVLGKLTVFEWQTAFPASSYSSTASDWNSGVPAPASQADIVNCSGRKAIFNEGGQPNKCSYNYLHMIGLENRESPVFSGIQTAYWSLFDMMHYVLADAARQFESLGYGPTGDPDPTSGSAEISTFGLDDSDWTVMPKNIVFAGLRIPEAIDYFCMQIGWDWRLDSWIDPTTNDIKYKYIFFKPGVATAGNYNIPHELYAGVWGEDLQPLLQDDSLNLVYAADMNLSVEQVVNKTVAIGGRHTHEISVELVPAWKDFSLWTITDTDDLFYSQSAIKALIADGTDSDDLTFYKKYCTGGSLFKANLNIGRKWALNEIGTYSHSDYDRGGPFDLNSVISSTTSDDYGFFLRPPSETLTEDADNKKINYLVEFSVDGGTTWHSMTGNAKVELLKGEWGIYIGEPNLSEIKLTDVTTEGTDNVFGTDSYETDGKEINYWSSLCYDMEASNAWGTTPAWNTRVRLTACIQTDKRITDTEIITGTKSAITQQANYDWSRKYTYERQENGSIFAGVSYYTAKTTDDRLDLQMQNGTLSGRVGQPSYGGQFHLPKIKLGEGEGEFRRPRFMVGDVITNIAGREFPLDMGNGKYAPIIQITYMPELDVMTIVTSDLNSSNVG